MSRKWVIFIAALCLLLGAAIAVLWFQPQPVKIDVNREDPVVGSGVAESVPQVITRIFNEETDKYLVRVEYPELQGIASTGLQAKVNNAIRSRVYSRVANFHAQNAEIFGNIPADFPEDALGQSSLESRYDVSLITGSLFSAVINYSEYSAGAAHPASFIEVLNYDLRSGEPLALEEFLEGLDPAAGYMSRLGTYVRQELTAELGNDPGALELISAGAAPTFENYERFNLGRNGLIVFFDSYQVAPFAAGTPEVHVPYDQLLSSILRSPAATELSATSSAGAAVTSSPLWWL